jgi:hypothetical protein
MDNNELLAQILARLNELSERVAALEKQEQPADDTASTASTLVRRDANGYIQASRVGAGVSPSYPLHVKVPSPSIVFESSNSDQNTQLYFLDNGATKGRLLYAGGNGAGSKYFGFINTAGDYLGFFSDSSRFLTAAAAAIATFDSGGLDLASGKTLEVNGTQVVTSRRTGWAAATGTATRTTFATTTVTTEQLAQRVKALIDDLITHGLIGA